MRRSIQLVTLNCALVVADEGSFLGASRSLGIHHSALSRRIRDLEYALGTILFERHTGGVRPTIAGARFLRNLRRILAELEGTIAKVEMIGRGGAGSLSIGFNAPLLAGEPSGAVTSFINDHRDVDFRFVEASHADLAAGLRDKTKDIVVVPSSFQLSYAVALPLWLDRVVVAIAAGQPLAGRATIEWENLNGETLLLGKHLADNELIDLLIAKVTQSQVPVSIVQHDVGRESLLGLVHKGLGVTLLPKCEVGPTRDGIAFPELRIGGNAVPIRYFAHWRPDNSNPVLASLVEFLRKLYPAS